MTHRNSLDLRWKTNRLQAQMKFYQSFDNQTLSRDQHDMLALRWMFLWIHCYWHQRIQFFAWAEKVSGLPGCLKLFDAMLQTIKCFDKCVWKCVLIQVSRCSAFVCICMKQRRTTNINFVVLFFFFTFYHKWFFLTTSNTKTLQIDGVRVSSNFVRYQNNVTWNVGRFLASLIQWNVRRKAGFLFSPYQPFPSNCHSNRF